MAHTTYYVGDLLAGLKCAGKTFEQFVAEVTFDLALCETLRDSPRSQPIRHRSKVQIESFVGSHCEKSLKIIERRGGRFDIFT